VHFTEPPAVFLLVAGLPVLNEMPCRELRVAGATMEENRRRSYGDEDESFGFIEEYTNVPRSKTVQV